MPIYEYVCKACGKRFEKIVLGAADAGSCPHCSSRDYQIQISVFAARTTQAGSRPSAGGGGCACTPSTCGCH